MKNTMTAIDIYMNRVFKALLIGLPVSTVVAAVTFTIAKLIGYYPTITTDWLIIFDASTLLYVFIGILLACLCEDKDKNLKPRVLLLGKILIVIIAVVHWNFITYLIPSRNHWAFFALFIGLSLFFLDHKLTLATAIGIDASIFISFFLKGDAILPVRDEFFGPELALRIIVIVFASSMFWLLAFLLERIFVKDLDKIADFDPLTMLYNRRTLPARLNEAIADYEHNKRPVTAFMCDLDDFKNINDTLGHDCGDKVLRNVASIINYTVGDQGVCFRYGGEEFFGLLFMDKNAAYDLAETIRRNVEKSRVRYKEQPVKITITVGIAPYEKGMSGDELIKASDVNLYYGKTHDKNIVIK